MKVLNIYDAPAVPFKLDGQILHQSDCFDLVHLCLKPGEVVEPHINPVTVVFFALEGEVLAGIDNESAILREGQYIVIEANLHRQLINQSGSPFKLLVIKYK